MKTPFTGTLWLAEADWPMIGPDRHRRRVAAGRHLDEERGKSSIRK
ncbi:MAG: hypothetical protein M3499_01025 [Actinomycetota bacterium]|nr:hypothetical protein [Actinomycetota bacterium]